MTDAQTERLVSQLAQARRGRAIIDALAAIPASVTEAHLVQDRVAALLAEEIGGFKANAPPDGPTVRGAIYASTIFASPARVPDGFAPNAFVEGEIAFRLLRDFTERERAYTTGEVAPALEALPAIELISGRLRDWQTRPQLEQLVDAMANAALIIGAPRRDWERALDIRNLPVKAWVGGTLAFEGIGGHPIGDPLAVAVALVNLMRQNGGVKAGQIVTTGSCTGLRPLRPGERFAVEFAGLGGAELQL
jgi:2-keto-4-pentenoate hydratase